MTLRTYWCVLQQADTKRSGKPYFREIGGFSHDLDLDSGNRSGLRGALLTGIHQYGGDESAISWYRMDVLDGDRRYAVQGYTAPPGTPPASLAEYTDGQLIAELARRLNGR